MPNTPVSIRHSLFKLFQSFIKLFTKHITHLADSLQTMSENLLSICTTLSHLESDVHNWLTWMRHWVSTKLNFVILDDHVSEQITQSVVLIQEWICRVAVISLRSMNLELRSLLLIVIILGFSVVVVWVHVYVFLGSWSLLFYCYFSLFNLLFLGWHFI